MKTSPKHEPTAPSRPAGTESPGPIVRALATFGLPAFRPPQHQVIEHVLSGRSALVVMPTGGGKSLCYQLPALLQEGLTLVVSPLIALMKDQVDALLERNIPATFINSSLPWEQQRQRLEQLRQGQLKLVYVAPERFRSESFNQAIADAPISLLAVDEAHCISQWGHDFRPDYHELGRIRELLKPRATLALTATATPRVQKDIVVQLGLQAAKVFVSGFDRPNLFLEVEECASMREKADRVAWTIERTPGPVIVYCSTRKAVEEIAAKLSAQFTRVGFYHAGLTDAARERVQEDFADGAVDVLVPPTPSAWASKSRTFEPSFTTHSPHRWKPITRRPGGPDATASRPAACCSITTPIAPFPISSSRTAIPNVGSSSRCGACWAAVALSLRTR
jgi:RecQ family ATP-dependent DNA helicase